ncbi:hypothetical protein TEA_022543 [Camellia sinensis var. sinensis]|uniref:DC-UbP/UBTD2 N-terminal domain-containing protein n=1 Tax=Camellia sinensis var. sinensis TaxID=542762 RepID=A0A4V3WJJ8_CAMSN|nr:hypothetical protein TEA_022543 [Camellia sinensis var. sinensis]
MLKEIKAKEVAAWQFSSRIKSILIHGDRRPWIDPPRSSPLRASTSPDWRRTLLPSNHLISLLNSSSSSSSPVVPFSATLLFSNPTAMASIPNPNPSPACVEAIEEIMKTYNRGGQSRHFPPPHRRTRTPISSLRDLPPRGAADEMFQTFDELIQRASELVFGTTQIEKSVDLGDPVGEIGRAGVIEKRVFGESVIDESSSIMAKTDDDFKYSRHSLSPPFVTISDLSPATTICIICQCRLSSPSLVAFSNLPTMTTVLTFNLHNLRFEIWDALQAAAEADLTLAQAIVDSAGVIVQAPDLTICYDERGAYPI